MSHEPTRPHVAVAALAVIVGFLFTPVTTLALSRHGEHGPGSERGALLHRILQRLDLTQEQKEAIHEAMGNLREETKGVHEQVREARREVGRQIHADFYDEAAIRQAATDLSVLEVELAVARGRMFQELRKNLTPEQRQKAHQMIEDMHALHDEMRSHQGKGGWHHRGD